VLVGARHRPPGQQGNADTGQDDEGGGGAPVQEPQHLGQPRGAAAVGRQDEGEVDDDHAQDGQGPGDVVTEHPLPAGGGCPWGPHLSFRHGIHRIGATPFL
jgi:hypothetical protein